MHTRGHNQKMNQYIENNITMIHLSLNMSVFQLKIKEVNYSLERLTSQTQKYKTEIFFLQRMHFKYDTKILKSKMLNIYHENAYEIKLV